MQKITIKFILNGIYQVMDVQTDNYNQAKELIKARSKKSNKKDIFYVRRCYI